MKGLNASPSVEGILGERTFGEDRATLRTFTCFVLVLEKIERVKKRMIKLIKKINI